MPKSRRNVSIYIEPNMWARFSKVVKEKTGLPLERKLGELVTDYVETQAEKKK